MASARFAAAAAAGAFAAAAVTTAAMSTGPALSDSLTPAAGASTKVAEFTASGFIFKDVVEVNAFPDPKIQGITLHVSNVKRSVAERLKKDFFGDPSQASVSASQTGPLRLLAPITLGPEGEEVFSAKKNLFFKTTHVRRIYDEANNAIVYVAYSTRLTQDMAEQNSRYRTSVSSIGLYGQNLDLKAAS